MSNVKDIKINKALHKEVKELAAWTGENMSVVAERAMRVELAKMKAKRAQAFVDPT